MKSKKNDLAPFSTVGATVCWGTTIRKVVFFGFLMVMLAILLTILSPRSLDDPVLLNALRESQGDLRKAIQSMAYVGTNETGEFEYVSLHRTIARPRQPSLKMNNGTLKALSEFKSIKTLIVDAPNDMNDDGMRYLAKLPMIENLGLLFVNVSDRGLDQLKQIKSLKRLTINSRFIDNSSILAFKLAIPGCRVQSFDLPPDWNTLCQE